MEFISKTLYPKIDFFLSIIHNQLNNTNLFYTIHNSYDNINYNDLEDGLLYFRNNNHLNLQKDIEAGMLYFRNNNFNNEF